MLCRRRAISIFLASAQEELGLLGAKHWLEASGYKPDMFIAVDVGSNQVWYGALRITQFKFFYTSPGAHTLESRGGPSTARALAKAIEAVYDIPLPPIAAGLDTFKLPVVNVGMLNGGTVTNAVPREAWFTVDLRSLDTATQARLEKAVEDAARRVGEQERRRLQDGEDHVRRLREGAFERGAAVAPARANGACDREPFSQARHAGDRPRRRRIDRRQHRRRRWAFPPSRSAPSSSTEPIGSRKPPKPAASCPA